VRTTARRAAFALACVLLAGGCQAAPARPPAPAQRLLAADLAQLADDRGLFTADGGLGAPGLYESAYGLATLALAGGRPRAGVDRSWLRAATADQVGRDPVFGRAYLAMLEQATGAALHDEADVTALRRMLTPQGFFADPTWTDSAARDPGFQLANTAAALQALAAFRVPLAAADRARIAGWLDRAGATAASTSLTQRWHLVQANRALGRPAPAGLGAALRGWWTRTGSRQRGAASGDALVETCSYIELAAATGTDLSAHRGVLTGLIRPARTLPDDLQLSYLVAHAWHALGNDVDGLLPLRRAITRLRGSAGLLPPQRVKAGDLASSAAAEQLRAAAGLATADPALAATLRRRRGVLVGADPVAAALWASTLATADPAARTEAANELRLRAPTFLSKPLTAANAHAFRQVITALRVVRRPVPPLRVEALPAATREQRYGRNLAIIALADAGQLGRLPAGDPAARIAEQGAGLLRAGSLVEAEAALTAAAKLGWRPTAADRDRLLALLRPLRGCPGTPALFRVSPAGSCDISATLAAWLIHRLLGGKNAP
jgi:hypothetical protein